jgi:hypothetical protein
LTYSVNQQVEYAATIIELFVCKCQCATVSLSTTITDYASPAKRDVADNILVQLVFVRIHNVSAAVINKIADVIHRFGQQIMRYTHDVSGERNHDDGQYQEKGLF